MSDHITPFTYRGMPVHLTLHDDHINLLAKGIGGRFTVAQYYPLSSEGCSQYPDTGRVFYAHMREWKERRSNTMRGGYSSWTKDGEMILPEPPPKVLEVTLDEVAAKFGVNVSNIKIKK